MLTGCMNVYHVQWAGSRCSWRLKDDMMNPINYGSGEPGGTQQRLIGMPGR
jgi:hypothetical protein